MTGAWPAGEVDHRNMKRDDDRWENLRDASHGQNNQNREKYRSNTSGYKGVVWHKGASKWMAQVWAGGKKYYLGLHDNIEEARAAYNSFASENHGEFARFE
jgi:hypothetical protein